MKDLDKILKTPLLTIDAFAMKNGKVLLGKRKSGTFANHWELPGGFVERGETLRKAVAREALEETGLKVIPQKIVGIYDDPKRDPRGHVVTVTYLCKITGGRIKPQENEVKEVRFFSIPEIRKLKLAFDHRKIINDALKMQGRKP